MPGNYEIILVASDHCNDAQIPYFGGHAPQKQFDLKHLYARWRALWHPNRYHGWGKRRNYFEGWYIKLVSPCERYAFAVIPGISMDKTGRQHAFLQVLDGKACTSNYHTFASTAFRPRADCFEVELGEHRFSEEGLQLQLPELNGRLQFEGNQPWPSRLGAPGIMGWYSFVPFMECYHGVVSLHHTLKGQLKVYGQEVDFSGGIGYIEKDWGSSFPSSWIWLQANHLSATEAPACLMASVARIPWLGNHFVGFLAGLQLEGQLYAFTTYNGASLSISLDETQKAVHLQLSRGTYRLEIKAHQKGGTGALAAPVAGAMAGKVNESLQSLAEVRLKKGRATLFEGQARHAGLEVAGAVKEELLI